MINCVSRRPNSLRPNREPQPLVSHQLYSAGTSLLDARIKLITFLASVVHMIWATPPCCCTVAQATCPAVLPCCDQEAGDWESPQLVRFMPSWWMLRLKVLARASPLGNRKYCPPAGPLGSGFWLQAIWAITSLAGGWGANFLGLCPLDGARGRFWTPADWGWADEGAARATAKPPKSPDAAGARN